MLCLTDEDMKVALFSQIATKPTGTSQPKVNKQIKIASKWVSINLKICKASLRSFNKMCAECARLVGKGVHSNLNPPPPMFDSKIF